MGFFDAQSVASWLIRDYAFPHTPWRKVAPMGQSESLTLRVTDHLGRDMPLLI
jgi:hypothetical protein